MQITVTIRKDRLSLPVNYHHILQAVIFKALEIDEEFSDFIHNEGYSNSDRKFKMFTFSEPMGKCTRSGNWLVFEKKMSFTVSSISPKFINLLREGFENNGCEIGRSRCTNVTCEMSEDTIEKTDLYISMTSPICVYSTDFDTKHTKYYNPDEMEFFSRINDSFKRKYEAFYGVMPKSDILLFPHKVKETDKTVTKYKDFIIQGWGGVYRIKGDRKYLDFLYQTGLGSKTAQGFGSFEVWEGK